SRAFFHPVRPASSCCSRARFSVGPFNADNSRVSASQGKGALAKRIGVRQELAPASQARFFGAPASSPRSRAARHVVRCEEYNPSRRNNAPTAPGVLHASASRTIFRLYSTVNRRRVAFAVTSISGPPRARSSTLIVLQSLLALD